MFSCYLMENRSPFLIKNSYFYTVLHMPEQRLLNIQFLPIEMVRKLEADLFTNAHKLRKRRYCVLRM